jgi:hypothetical protein
MEKKTIGRKDQADFPHFNLKGIPVKVDTGAYTSSIHCDVINKKIIDGKTFLEIIFFNDESENNFHLLTDEYTTKIVKSSSGIPEERYFIKGTIQLFGVIIETPFSLTTRENMKFPVLLGRKLLNKRFVVDPSRTNVSWNWEIENVKK